MNLKIVVIGAALMLFIQCNSKSNTTGGTTVSSPKSSKCEKTGDLSKSANKLTELGQLVVPKFQLCLDTNNVATVSAGDTDCLYRSELSEKMTSVIDDY